MASIRAGDHRSKQRSGQAAARSDKIEFAGGSWCISMRSVLQEVNPEQIRQAWSTLPIYLLSCRVGVCDVVTGFLGDPLIPTDLSTPKRRLSEAKRSVRDSLSGRLGHIWLIWTLPEPLPLAWLKSRRRASRFRQSHGKPLEAWPQHGYHLQATSGYRGHSRPCGDMGLWLGS